MTGFRRQPKCRKRRLSWLACRPVLAALLSTANDSRWLDFSRTASESRHEKAASGNDLLVFLAYYQPMIRCWLILMWLAMAAITVNAIPSNVCILPGSWDVGTIGLLATRVVGTAHPERIKSFILRMAGGVELLSATKGIGGSKAISSSASPTKMATAAAMKSTEPPSCLVSCDA